MQPVWHRELNDELTSISAHPLPDDLIKRLKSFDLHPTNQESLTLDVLHRLADAALGMTQDLMPPGVLPDLRAHIEINTPASYLQVTGIILAAFPRMMPSQRLRKSMVQLLFATRPIARDARRPHEASLSPIRTAAFLAMWSTVYAEYCQSYVPDSAARHIEAAFS